MSDKGKIVTIEQSRSSHPEFAFFAVMTLPTGRKTSSRFRDRRELNAWVRTGRQAAERRGFTVRLVDRT